MGRRAAARRLFGALAVLVLGWLYVDAAFRHGSLVNTTLENTDQAAYFQYAVNLHERGAAHIGNRNQMPLYPFLQSLVYDPGMSVEDSFARAKAFNIVLSVALLAVLFVLWRRTFPPLQTAALLLVTAFTVFLFKAAYVQVELLAYVLAREGLAPARTIMLGDRRHDVEGARANGMACLGVTYGYGDRAELEQAGATWICDDLAAALAVLDGV